MIYTIFNWVKISETKIRYNTVLAISKKVYKYVNKRLRNKYAFKRLSKKFKVNRIICFAHVLRQEPELFVIAISILNNVVKYVYRRRNTVAR